MQNDTAIVINNVPRPKFIVSKIEQLKDYAIKNRIQGSEEELPRSEKTKAGIHIPHELREEIKEEVYEDLRDEIKREVKQEFKENLKTEILDEMH
jgi:anaerobic ribonucleoside-triphosphate reductase